MVFFSVASSYNVKVMDHDLIPNSFKLEKPTSFKHNHGSFEWEPSHSNWSDVALLRELSPVHTGRL